MTPIWELSIIYSSSSMMTVCWFWWFSLPVRWYWQRRGFSPTIFGRVDLGAWSLGLPFVRVDIRKILSQLILHGTKEGEDDSSWLSNLAEESESSLKRCVNVGCAIFTLKSKQAHLRCVDNISGHYQKTCERSLWWELREDSLWHGMNSNPPRSRYFRSWQELLYNNG